MTALRRRGLIDITRFQKRWDRRLRLLENGRPQRVTGRPVEELLRSESHWTVIMICIVAALDEFTSSSMVRNICKALLHRLFPGQDGIDMTEDVLNSQIGNRIEAWRSAGTVREMHVACRNKRVELMKQDLVVQGSMPEEETAEFVEFLHWLVAQETGIFRTSSSDIAAIGCCLSLLSFESLTVEGFDCSLDRETNCRLIYNKASLYSGYGARLQDGRKRPNRELSTVVSLTQPEETFSTFPITHEVANKCRAAWERGSDAGKFHVLEPNYLYGWGWSSNDIPMCLTNKGTSVTELRGRKDPKIWSLLSLLAIFSNPEVCNILTEVVGRESHDTISQVVRVISTPDSDGSSGLDDPDVCDTFTVCQAFFMGYYYSIFSKVVDTSTLEVQTVSGHWGYRSPDFLRKMAQFLRHASRSTKPNRNRLEVARSQVLQLVAILYANMEITTPTNTSNGSLSHQETCVGVIGKRIILNNSLLINCNKIGDISRFVILDCDAGGIPHTPAGLVLTGIPPRQKTWEDEDPPIPTEIYFLGPTEDCTRHIEADWDRVPENVLLCIRYKGRRLGSLNPAYADIAFCRATAAAGHIRSQQSFAREVPIDFFTLTAAETSSKADESPTGGLVGMHESRLEDLTGSGRLVTPGRHGPNIPVAVHTSLKPCFRYAATAWYSELGDVVFVDEGTSGNHSRAGGIGKTQVVWHRSLSP